MLENIEFYTCPDGSINFKKLNEPVKVFNEESKDIISEMLIVIRDLYPNAFKALSEIYSKSQRNRDFFEYRIVSRFIRCNFGEYDALTFDINNAGVFNIEEVKCPLRGECIFEGEICKAKMKTSLTAREEEVALLFSSGMTRQEIAQELNISIYTVIRHLFNIKARLKLKNSNQIISFFNGRN